MWDIMNDKVPDLQKYTAELSIEEKQKLFSDIDDIMHGRLKCENMTVDELYALYGKLDQIYLTLNEENIVLTEINNALRKQNNALREQNIASIVSLAKTFYTDFETIYSEIIKLPQYANLTEEDVKKYY